jgi:hypothetical protein
MASAPKSAIARACGLLLQRGVSAAEVLKVEACLRRLAEGGLVCQVELPEHRLLVTLPATGRARRKLYRPGRV